MDRHRGDRSRGPSRWSDGPPQDGDHPFRHPNGHPRGDGEGFFGARHHPYRGGGAHDHNHPGDGGRGPGFRPGPNTFDRDGVPRRGGGFPGPGRNASSPGGFDGHRFAKLFIGGVPRTATEDEIRPPFEEHGQVMEVALIKDRRTGQQQSCCFVKYATSDEADRAIRALHNQCTLPGGIGPIQVRYADGERERLGTVEHKLFVGALHKQATELEVEEIFAPFGHVEDVYIMRDEYKQSRGCGFVKFSNREFAAEAINALNGVYRMRGCDQPLIVRFADPKRPRPGEARGGPAFGGPGFGPRHPAPSGPQPSSSFDEPIGGLPNKVWSSTSPESSGPSSHGLGGFGGHLYPTAFPAPSSTGFSPAYIQPMGQQMPALQNPLTSPQHLLESVQAHPSHQNASPYHQIQGSQAQAQQLSQLQNLSSGNFMTLPPGLASMQLPGSGGQVSSSQPQLHMSATANLEVPTHLQQAVSVPVNQQMLPGSAASQLLQHPVQQPAQTMLQPQQTHFLQAGFQSSHQLLSQNRQVQLMQPSNPNLQLNTQQSSLTASHQPFSSSQVAVPISVVPSMMTSLLQQNKQAGVPISCNWSEHTSPDGFKYYYNCVTKESKWEKPEELTLMEQQQQKLVTVQQLPSQPQIQASQVQSTHQLSQVQQSQPHMQFIQQVQLQQLQPLPAPRMQP